NAYISSYDGTVAVLDTATLSITKYITVGSYPEGLVVANDKLYIANSGAGRTNTVSVIDLAKLIEIKKITVIPYPITMAADDFGNVYVMSAVDYISDSITYGGMTVIDSKTDLVKSQPAVSVGFNIPITMQGDFIYFFTLDNKLAVYNAKTQTFVTGNFIADGSIITSPMAITVSPLTGEVFIGDGKDNISNGNLYAFDKNGKLEYTLTTGINPGKIVLLNE
ncbi:MAG: YncE family protein, partial [Bacteroidota bacterium]|nr:YncE family protein [Bacteroidota bacterium]